MSANPYMEELKETISQIGQGILGSDQSPKTTGLYLATLGLENTEENRKLWYELLFSTANLSQYLGGASVYEEALSFTARDGTPFMEMLKAEGLCVGVRMDKGLEPLEGSEDECSTVGLEGLAERCQEYYAAGVRFAKWRAVFRIGDDTPSDKALETNVNAMVRFALTCQENGLVPVTHAEVALGPGEYSVEEAGKVSERVCSAVIEAYKAGGVILEGTMLKTNMVLPGLDAPSAPKERVASSTIKALVNAVPPAVPCISFLSGGMGSEESTNNLMQLHKEAADAGMPWSLSFAFGRALEEPVFGTWQGKQANWEAAQAMLLALSKANSEARQGTYTGPHPAPAGRVPQAV